MFSMVQISYLSLREALYYMYMYKAKNIYEEFKCKNRYINFHQFEIFAIKAAEKQRK